MRRILLTSLCLTISCSNQTNEAITTTDTDCLIYKGIYAPRSEVNLIPSDVAVQIKKFNVVWESRCLNK